ncbi:MAG TPA: SDR family oxidoreductase [Hyphomicrobiaceae bacterium]|jgi:3-oxoacyl-[acyl-carrier protein] reductase|nr:SDR family oxidoreductase [Hyphomicrobiaceae bacterium]
MPAGLSLKDKVALVVGGAGGIGAATCAMLAEEGALVAMTHRPAAEAQKVAEAKIAALPGSGHVALPADVADTATLLALRDQISHRFGRLHILVNSAGFTKAVPHGDLDELTDELIDRMFQVNWRGQYAAIRTFAPMLKASGDGLIVNVSSIAGFTGAGSSIVYGATKAGIDVMTRSLARVLAPQVRVLGVSPGAVDTTFVPGRGPDFNAKAAAAAPLKRIATPEDVARAIVACATHLTYSTGVTVVVDGGRSL